jgi:hypothetical protein
MDATRTIEVHVSGCEFECCGVPFGVGEEIGFTLAGLPSTPADAGTPEFADVRHRTDDAQPLRDVRGRVERIVAVHARVVAVPGAHYRTSDPDDTVEREVDAVPADDGPGGYSGADYRVRLRIPASTPLPPRPPAAPGPEDPPEPDGPRSLLTAVIDHVVARYGDGVDVLRARGDAAVTLAPRRPGAATVRWNARDGIVSVELERAMWRLPWDASGAVTLLDLVEAAARGGFAEHVDGGRFVARATTPDGRVLSTSASAPAPQAEGPMLLPRSVHERLQRARSGEPYPPWVR